MPSKFKTKSRTHWCYSQELGEPKPKRCSCRKYIDLAEATILVNSGMAQWVIVDWIKVAEKTEICTICLNDGILKKSCKNCTNGLIYTPVYHPKYHPKDIVVTSVASIDERNGKTVYRSARALKTPRVATIERSHCERAYVSGDQDEIDRIEAYGELGREFINSLMAPFREDPTEGRILFCFAGELRTKGGY